MTDGGPDLTQQESDELARLGDLWEQDAGWTGPAERPPLDPRVRRRRRWIALAVVAVVVLAPLGAAGGYAAWALNAPLPTPVAVTREPAVPTTEPVAFALPAEGSAAISVAGADAYLGEGASGVWLTSGDGGARPIASISKIITALVILDRHPLADAADAGPTITFDEAAHDLYDEYYVLGATIAEMPAGSSMSLRDALATMLIPSASNYAEAVSTWAFGSQGAFLSATRRWLADHGLGGTVIVEPTGISSRNASTPADLITIGRLAAANPAIAAITSTRSLSLPELGVMTNTNSLLDDGFTGLKTGNLGEGTYNLLYSATIPVGAEQPLDIVGVALGGASRWDVEVGVRNLVDSIRSGFRQVPLIQGGTELGTYTTPWGSSASLVASRTAAIFAWSDTPITLTMDVTEPVAYEDGEVVGSLTWTAGPHTETIDLEVAGTIEPPDDWWRLTHPDELRG